MKRKRRKEQKLQLQSNVAHSKRLSAKFEQQSQSKTQRTEMCRQKKAMRKEIEENFMKTMYNLNHKFWWCVFARALLGIVYHSNLLTFALIAELFFHFVRLTFPLKNLLSVKDKITVNDIAIIAQSKQ